MNKADTPADTSNTPGRPVEFFASDVRLRRIRNDTFIMNCNEELRPYDRCVGGVAGALGTRGAGA